MIYSVLVFDEMTMDTLDIFEGTREECEEYILSIDLDVPYDLVIED